MYLFGKIFKHIMYFITIYNKICEIKKSQFIQGAIKRVYFQSELKICIQYKYVLTRKSAP